MKRLTLLGAVFAVLLGFVVGGLTGCSEDEGDFIGNLRPGVTLTATPPEGDTTRYDVEFHWTAWDYDGEVDYFIYCIDPPDSANADTAWIRTDGYNGRFTFTALAFDTTTIDDFLDWKNPQIALGFHVFVIKAVDDRGATSPFDYLAFNAATIAPRSVISSPPPFGAWNEYMGTSQPVGLRVTFRWDGDDTDGIFTDKPVGYMYKTADITGEKNWRNVGPRVLEDPAPWIRLGSGTTQVTLEFDDGHAYGFAVRAIDEASAVEPLLVLNRNLLWIGAADRLSFPELSIRSAAFGVRRWQGWTMDSESYEVPLGSQYEFTIVGDAGWYGGLITGYSYGWDLENLESPETSPDGIGAWTPWSTTRTTISAQFTEARDQFLYIRCKDDGGGFTLATIHFRVITLNPTKNLGYIDDWRKYPKWSTQGEILDDIVWQRFLDGYDYGEGWSELVWDEWDAPYGEEMPTLEFLSDFRVLVWSLNDNRMINARDKSAWYQMSYLETMHMLAVYLGSEAEGGEKGKLWAFGRGLVESSVLPYGGTHCEYPYAVRRDARLDACFIRNRSFAYDYLHIIGDYLNSDTEAGGARIHLFENPNDNLVRVFADTAGPSIPDYPRDPATVLYPELPAKLALDPVRGRAIVNEVLDYPLPTQENQLLFYDPWLDQVTNLIPLYRYHAKTTISKAHNKYCGFRYLPSRVTDHGEIVYFFFPMYPIADNDARAVVKVVLSEWFGLPDPDASVPIGGPVGR